MHASLTIAMITARQEPMFQWFFDSLRRQTTEWAIEVILVDFLASSRDMSKIDTRGFSVRHVPCKPTVWQGEHRRTRNHWWAISTYRNTAACLCRTEWFAVLDDRSVLAPTYLRAVERAMKGGYACAGRYQKRTGMTVTDGEITTDGVIVGEDPRFHRQRLPSPMAGSNFFGANSVQPLEFVLKINGWDESCDSLGLEDCVYGLMLERNRLPIRYDPELYMIEDRSPDHYETFTRRMDKGPSPNDKSHGVLARTAGKKQATHDLDLRATRDLVLAGQPFPIPTTPTHDWWDGQPLEDFP